MTDRQRRFVEEYLVDLNADRAARCAGYRGKSAGAGVLRNPEVRRLVDGRIQERAKRVQVRQEEVLGELKKIAMAEASDESGAAVKMGSKLKALELLGRHLGMFEGRGGQVGQTVRIVDDLKS